MAERSWYDGQVYFGGIALGGCREARLRWSVLAPDTTVCGDSIEQSLVLQRVTGMTVTVTGLENATTHHVWAGTRGTLSILESDGTTGFTATNVLANDPEWGNTYNDATTYSIVFKPETLPTIPDFSYVTALTG